MMIAKVLLSVLFGLVTLFCAAVTTDMCSRTAPGDWRWLWPFVVVSALLTLVSLINTVRILTGDV